MVNNIWSTRIQGIQSLDLSRELRFRDDRKDLFLRLLGLSEGMTILDVGCGPGTITRKLSKWLGERTKIIGVDRDTGFIRYAKETAAGMNLTNVHYQEGDALELPLEDNSVDASISFTVIEHLPNRRFLSEQKRVCRPAGRVSVMYAQPDKYIKTAPDALPKRSKREMELMDKLFKKNVEIIEEYNVGKYWPDPVNLPLLFQEVGFEHVQVDAIAVPIAIDDARNDLEEKARIILSEKEQLLEQIEMVTKSGLSGLQDDETVELRALIEERTLKRLELVQIGNTVWDYTILLLQIVSGAVS